ncbi:MAG: (R)-mandelonitrile lyase [Gemmatimonadaceae bacterium]
MKHTAIMLLALPLAYSAPALAQDTRELVITRAAARPSRVASAENFTGTARVQPLFDTTATTRAYGASVSFDPGARTAWHTHARGQILIVTEGVGRVQRWGAPIEEVRPGDVVRIPPNVKHWHGAAPASAMAHIAIVENLNGRSTDWMEKSTTRNTQRLFVRRRRPRLTRLPSRATAHNPRVHSS